MTQLEGMESDCFWQSLSPKKTWTISTEDKELRSPNIQKIENFFGWDLLTLLGQGPIKRIPKMRNKEKVEEPLSPEMEAELKKVFWENYDQINF